MSTEFDAYLRKAPENRREALTALRAACQEELAGFTESWSWGMPSYARDEVEVAFANQKQYISLYVLRSDVLDAHRDRLSHLDVGKSCVRFRKPADVDMEVVRSMLRATAATQGEIC